MLKIWPQFILYIPNSLLHFFIDGRESGDLGMYIFSRKILPLKLFFPDQLYLKNVKQASLFILVIFLLDIVEQLKLRIAIFIST